MSRTALASVSPWNKGPVSLASIITRPDVSYKQALRYVGPWRQGEGELTFWRDLHDVLAIPGDRVPLAVRPLLVEICLEKIAGNYASGEATALGCLGLMAARSWIEPDMKVLRLKVVKACARRDCFVLEAILQVRPLPEDLVARIRASLPPSPSYRHGPVEDSVISVCWALLKLHDPSHPTSAVAEVVRRKAVTVAYEAMTLLLATVARFAHSPDPRDFALLCSDWRTMEGWAEEAYNTAPLAMWLERVPEIHLTNLLEMLCSSPSARGGLVLWLDHLPPHGLFLNGERIAMLAAHPAATVRHAVLGAASRHRRASVPDMDHMPAG